MITASAASQNCGCVTAGLRWSRLVRLIERRSHSVETLILRLVEGMTGPEIAAQTGLTPDSVRVNLCRGMKMLRELLEAK
ncbi:MAG: hypothetical protein NTW28_26550 [Candidatus Solibacter sp.]|nr:hypothetical protein [Candidatus Solibacter sp.]